jgi:uncharacterized protein (TIGR02246 family)
MIRHVRTATLSAVFVLAACAPKAAVVAPPPAAPDANTMRPAIEAQMAKAATAFTTRDTAAMGSLFTEDATWTLSDGTTFKGHGAITKGAAGFFASVDSLHQDGSTIDELIVVNDSEIVTFSTWQLTVKEKGKKSEKHVNPFADIWRKGSDGTWRVAREINAEGPAK